MNPGQLRHELVIQHRAVVSPSKNNMGEEDYAWANFHTTRGRIRAPTMRGKEQAVAEAEESVVDTEILIRYFSGITAAMRVVFGSIIYDIQSVVNVEERNRELVLMCTRGNSRG
jgi:SPP1 family predicted phage head-tail adaptor